ncbi:restriction endonuclease subunit S [Holdemanella biformis]|uniref:restriction endonuclease subunit S n=1 Tax=Holdemanella biformis TaxID=1735 RepID=UPI0022E47727|nr:restriction endonuclease subunit S [Holdemanella biformis]
MIYKTIEELTTVVTGGTPSTLKAEYWENGNIPWLQSGCCQNRDVNQADKFISQSGYDNSSTQVMPVNTVMIALTGATAGKIGYLNIEACGNQSITGIFPCEELNPRFLFYFLISQRRKILVDCVGGAQAHISQGYVKKIKVPVYSKNIQERIVNIMNICSKNIKHYEMILKEYDELVKARFIEMFGRPFINNMNWESRQIKNVVNEVKYGTSKPSVENGEYKYLRMNNLTYDGRFDLTDLKFISLDNDELEKCVVRKGDVLFNRTNSLDLIGKTADFDFDEDMVIAGYIIRIRLKETIVPKFFSMYMNTDEVKIHLRTIAKGAVNQANINAQELQEIPIYLPPIELQNQFVDFVRQVDKSRFDIKKSIIELEREVVYD